jgi:hypothetical protein
MNANTPIERRIAVLLGEEALVQAPERVLETALLRVDGLAQRRSPWARLAEPWAAVSARRRLLIALAALVLATGAVAAGAALLRPPDPLVDPAILILVQRVDGVADPATPVDVYAVDPTGASRVLMTIGHDASTGPFGDLPGSLSADGYLAVPTSDDRGPTPPAIVDLRDPIAPFLRPDGIAVNPRFGPDGRLAMQLNDGRLAIYDPARGTTRWLTPPSGLDVGLAGEGLTWTTEGRLLAQDINLTTDDTLVMGSVDATGLPIDGPAIGYYDGTGSRRVDGQGRWLRCSVSDAYSCFSAPSGLRAAGALGSPVVWSNDDPTVALSDYAWAADGGLWLLLETTTVGPRSVSVHRIGTDGADTTIATFDGAPDGATSETHFSAARFAGLARDDSRIVIRASGLEGSVGPLWLLTTRSGRLAELPDGTVAGWIDPATLAKPRLATDRVPEAPEAIRGFWSDGFVGLTVSRTGFTLRTGTWERATVPVRSTGDDTIAIENLSTIPGCSPGDATYRWSIDGARLTLSPADEPCAQRGEILARSFERALPQSKGGDPAIADPGVTYRTTTFAEPFRITIPPDMHADVRTTDEWDMELARQDSAATVHVFVPKRGMDDPCVRRGTAIPIGAGIDGVMDYITSRQALLITPYKPVHIGATAVSTIWIDPMQKCPMELFVDSDGSSYTSVPTRLAVVERPDGTAVAFLISTSRPEDERWVDELLGSLEWLP